MVALSVVSVLPRLASQARQTPLALSVDLQPDGWLVSWNPRASAIRTARGARLYVVSAHGSSRLELGPAELSGGRYLHVHSTDDHTFRLEIEEATGRVAAESFRLVRR